jgi:hypothetical protein
MRFKILASKPPPIQIFSFFLSMYTVIIQFTIIYNLIKNLECMKLFVLLKVILKVVVLLHGSVINQEMKFIAHCV